MNSYHACKLCMRDPKHNPRSNAPFNLHSNPNLTDDLPPHPLQFSNPSDNPKTTPIEIATCVATYLYIYIYISYQNFIYRSIA